MQPSPPFGEVWIEIPRPSSARWAGTSPPFGEVWIEILIFPSRPGPHGSPPFGEVWIEIRHVRIPDRSPAVTSLRGGVD